MNNEGWLDGAHTHTPTRTLHSALEDQRGSVLRYARRSRGRPMGDAGRGDETSCRFVRWELGLEGRDGQGGTRSSVWQPSLACGPRDAFGTRRGCCASTVRKSVSLAKPGKARLSARAIRKKKLRQEAGRGARRLLSLPRSILPIFTIRYVCTSIYGGSTDILGPLVLPHGMNSLPLGTPSIGGRCLRLLYLCAPLPYYMSTAASPATKKPLLL